MKFSFTKNAESESFYKESKSNKKKKFWQVGGGGGGGGGVEVWLGLVIFLFFFQKIQVGNFYFFF